LGALLNVPLPGKELSLPRPSTIVLGVVIFLILVALSLVTGMGWQ